MRTDVAAVGVLLLVFVLNIAAGAALTFGLMAGRRWHAVAGVVLWVAAWVVALWL